MRKLSHLSLTQKLLFAVALPLCGVAIVLGIIVQAQLSRAIPSLIDNTAMRQVDARADEVSQWLNGYRKWLNVLAQDERLSRGAPLERHVDWLAKRYQTDGTIESLFVSDAQGNTINQEGMVLNIAERPYFQALMTDATADRMLLDPFVSKATNEPAALMVETLFNEQGQRVGIIGIALSLDTLSSVTTDIDVGKGSYGWLIDSQGRVIAHPNADYRLTLNYADGDETHDYEGLSALSGDILSGEPGTGEIVMPSGERKTLIWSPVDETSWVVGTTVPMSVFTGVTHQLLMSLLIAGVVLFGLLLIVVAFAARRALAPIKHTARAMKDIAQGKGDLTRRLSVDTQDEVGDLAQGFNAFAERMQATLSEVRHNAQTVLGTAVDMADSTQELSTRTDQAAANLQETSASMEQIHSTVAHTSQASEQASGLAVEAASASQRGTESMARMEEKMASISESSTKISDIIGLIDSIAFQTNILALNASVEAARAGEQGRGFAVVANEVRTLASRSASAAQEIRTLIDVSVDHAQQGNDIVRHAAQQMREIHRSITQVSDVVGEITAGAREQTAGIEQVNTAVAEMDTMTQQNAAMVSQSASLAAGMRENAEQLDRLMGEFILDHTTHVATRHPAKPSSSIPPQTPAAPKALAKPSVAEPEWEAF
ncbi:methyl-accepting chemotaxis protein [Halomonas sp. GD1P12]|uniref:methyl-accepting chemotaxis protein n=1 Tax=Halomonas sp. GD1P12 TaxID=2982691 RepID=UPI0021E4F12D|nr:methyl-accepting chemotaxis protein [Halomonas sp. GD1P12]UYF99635.1 methyl-accepting chemotaxis protein [Halomonas sp. GD1P12]